MKKKLFNLIFAIALSLSSHGIFAQSNLDDSNKLEVSSNKILAKLTNEVNANTKAIAEIYIKSKCAGNLISEVARLQNQSRAVLIFGSAVGGIVLASTGNIPAFLAITGLSGIVSAVDALLSTSKLREAGTTLNSLISTEPNQSHEIPSSSAIPTLEGGISNDLTINARFGAMLCEVINKNSKYQYICPNSNECLKYGVFQAINFHDCKIQLDQMEGIEDVSYKMLTIQDLEQIDKEIDTNPNYQFLRDCGWFWSSSFGVNFGEMYCFNFSTHERVSILMTNNAHFFCVKIK
jgi:hypothetical protein